MHKFYLATFRRVALAAMCFAAVFVVSVLFSEVRFEQVHAQSSAFNVSGFGWGADFPNGQTPVFDDKLIGNTGNVGGIGWVSFNCSNTSSCGASNYGVNLNSDNTLTGNAWSSNFGWIQFGGLSGFPSGSGTTASNARLNNNKLEGWARLANHDTTPGWDGWISLGGTNYSISKDQNGKFSGHAWGGPDGIGWISFSVSVPPTGCTSNCNPTDYGVTTVPLLMCTDPYTHVPVALGSITHFFPSSTVQIPQSCAQSLLSTCVKINDTTAGWDPIGFTSCSQVCADGNLPQNGICQQAVSQGTVTANPSPAYTAHDVTWRAYVSPQTLYDCDPTHICTWGGGVGNILLSDLNSRNTNNFSTQYGAKGTYTVNFFVNNQPVASGSVRVTDVGGGGEF